jgi:hypothetical protein
MPLWTMTLIGVLALLPGSTVAGQGPDEAKDEARTAAREWLARLDAQDYDETWKTAGELLKAAVGQEEWSAKLSVTLGPLGKVDSRGVRSSEYSTTMPGAPDGEYVVVKFDTSFENKQTAQETMVLKREPDGAWKVSGSFIR